MSSPDAGNGVAPSPDGTGGSPSSDKTSADKTSPSLDKAEPSTDPSSGAAVGAPDGSEQVVGAPEESGKGNIEEDVGALHFQVLGSSYCVDILIMLLPVYGSCLSNTVLVL